MRLSFLALLGLAGCSYFDPASVAGFDDTSPLTLDPAGLSVAVTLPDGVQLAPGSVTMTLSAKSASGRSTEESVTLDQLSQGNRQRWRVPPDRVDAWRATQARILAWDAEDDIDGNFSLAVTPCFLGRAPEPNERFSTYLRSRADGPDQVMIRSAPFSLLYEALDETGTPELGADCAALPDN